MSAPGLQGLRPWIIQRITAVYIALYILYFSFLVLFSSPVNESDWSAWVALPYNNIALGLFLLAVLWHAWIGVRDIVLDYVPNVVGRMVVLTGVACVLLGSGLWGLKALFMVAIQ